MEAGRAAIRIVHVTDVYTLENFPSLKTFLEKTRAEGAATGTKVVSVLTGDFLAPYLLASVDHGRGMMAMLNETPIDYLTWGNHDGNDMPHRVVMEREKEYKGVWINSNMTTHESFAGSTCQTDAAVVEVSSIDGAHRRKLGMCAVLSNDPGLYKPNAFGGATIEDPWETLKTYKAKLEDEHGVDLVLPLCHLYEWQDERTCHEFDFPLILSGHDHHCVDRMVHGTRLLKPGQDCRHAVVVDIVWESEGTCAPTITAHTISVTDFEADVELAQQVRKAYSVLDRLQGTQLVCVPEQLRPFSSFGSRDRHVSAGTFLCNSYRDALNMHCPRGNLHCDSVLLKGGNVRGSKDYADDEQFSLESLLSEVMEECHIHMFIVPGRCIQVGLKETWEKPSPGWLQYSDDVVVDADGLVVSIAGAPLDPDRLYRIGSAMDLKRASDGPTIGEWLADNPSCVLDTDGGMPGRALLLGLFAAQAWCKLWAALDVNHDGTVSLEELHGFDTDCDGALDRKELLTLLHEVAGFATDAGETEFVDAVLCVAGDEINDHKVDLQQMNEKHRLLQEELGLPCP